MAEDIDSVDMKNAVAGLNIHVGHTTDRPSRGAGRIFLTFFRDVIKTIRSVIDNPEYMLSAIAADNR